MELVKKSAKSFIENIDSLGSMIAKSRLPNRNG
jgi:hypothetical protein